MNRQAFISPIFIGVLFLSACSHSPKNSDSAESLTANSAPFPTETAPYIQNWDERKLAATSQYQTSGTCAGLPKVNLKTAPGFCVGLVDNGEGMLFPRTAIEKDNNEIIVVDMGGWTQTNGRLYSLKYINGQYQRSLLLKASEMKNSAKKVAMDRPHLILRGPDGLFYIGSASAISRFDPRAPDIEKSLEIVIANIPAQGLHPLKAFAFDEKGNLYINVGSATNVCEKDGFFFKKSQSCLEAEAEDIGQALIRKYFREANGSYSKNYKIFARGLRNSMGLWWNSNNQILVQAENSRDNVSKYQTILSNADLPHEEVNFLQEGRHYGWPYCYDNNLANPEWQNISCARFTTPDLLLPAHASPLSILNYTGAQFPSWYKNRLLMSFHGYEPRGHRIVAFLRDDRGLPTGKPLSVVYGWDANGSQAAGSPVGLSQMKDGTVLIVEDKSRKVLRLAFDARTGDGKPVAEIPDSISNTENDVQKTQSLKLRLEKALSSPNPPLFAKIQSQIIDKHCSSCHTGADARGMELNLYDFESNEQRILAENKGRDIYQRMLGGTALAQMPPDGFANDKEKQELLQLYLSWLNKH